VSFTNKQRIAMETPSIISAENEYTEKKIANEARYKPGLMTNSLYTICR
jgi:hypothetical protein